MEVFFGEMEEELGAFGPLGRMETWNWVGIGDRVWDVY